MIAQKVKANKSFAPSNLDKTTDSLSDSIWKRLSIIKTEAWFEVVVSIAKKNKVRAKLESRYRKTANIFDNQGYRIGRIWHLDENMPIFWAIKPWISHFESANTINEAIESIVRITAN